MMTRTFDILDQNPGHCDECGAFSKALEYHGGEAATQWDPADPGDLLCEACAARCEPNEDDRDFDR